MRGAQELSLDFSSLNFTQDINLRLLQARLTQFPKQKGGRRSSPLASLANYVSFSSVGFVVTTKYWFEDCHCHSARASFFVGQQQPSSKQAGLNLHSSRLFPLCFSQFKDTVEKCLSVAVAIAASSPSSGRVPHAKFAIFARVMHLS